MEYTGRTGEFFELKEVGSENCFILKEKRPDTLRLLWFTSDNNQIKIDNISYTFNTNDIICITQFHQLEIVTVNTLKLMSFNQPFYCILDHDSEIGCKGLLYYGAAVLPILKPDDMEVDIIHTAWQMALFEFEMKDNLQLEMLQMMLKRILILCTRIYKNQYNHETMNTKHNDIVREFNYLVETHFKEKHTVADYADLLFKSAKTLSNIFKKLGEKTPLQFIQDRLMLEARRLLWYTDKDISQIAYDIGFNDIHSFSRFFKKNEGVSPSGYRLNK